jgi:hypothetical protein
MCKALAMQIAIECREGKLEPPGTVTSVWIRSRRGGRPGEFACLDVDRDHSWSNESARGDESARRDDRDPLIWRHAGELSDFRRDFGEEFGLQFREMAEGARHSARGVMLGEAIRREHEGAAWVVGRTGVGIIRTLLLVCGWIELVRRIEGVAHW